MLRLGLLSTATINQQILRGAAASEHVDVVAVASRDAAKAQAYAEEHGLEHAHGSYEALLADDGVDAVYVSLPNGLHHEWSLRAVEAGKHVLCEKPYSRHPEEVEEAFEVAEARGLVLMEAFMYRHHPQTARVRELVEQGAIGRLVAVDATFSFRLDDLANVRASTDLEGGALMDVGCYCVSGIRLLAGEPQRARGEQVVGPTGVDMAFHGILRCADDVVGQFEASFLAPGRQRLEAVGSDGVLTVAAPWRVDWGGAVTLALEGEEARTIDVGVADSYRLELDNLADAVAGRAPQLLGRDDALGQARVIEALYRSAGEGRAMELGWESKPSG